MRRLTFDVRGRRSGEAAKGNHKRSLWAVPFDGMVRFHLPCRYLKIPFSIFAISLFAYSATDAFPSSIATSINES
jgi:hypothetical protein